MRRLRSEKCGRCGLPPVLCLCEALVAVESPVRVVVVMHGKEAPRPSNSGRLVPLLLAGSSVCLRGLEPVGVFERPAAVLFPDSAAPELSASEGLRTLFVPDGNWRQARRIARREPAFEGLPVRRLPDGPPPLARLRGHPDDGHLSTLEAVARALGLLAGAEVQAHLEAAWLRFAAAVERLRLGGV